MTTTNYFISGNTINLQRADALTIAQELPPAVYYVRYNSMTKSLFLSRTDEFTPPKKLYGEATRNADRVIRTFNDRTKSTGVLLEGVKGSGKTLLTKIISAKLLEQGVPTIIVDQQFDGPSFNEFIGTIGTAMVIFDEFEKVFSESDDSDGSPSSQESLLTLFDGTVDSKKLFVLSVNDSYRVNEFFINRPGRIFYNFAFRGLSDESIVEYCQDVLKDQDQIPTILKIAKVFGDFTFDILAALVEEMNRYDESAVDAIRFMNVKPAKAYATYELSVVSGDKEFDSKADWHPKNITSEPTVTGESLYVRDYVSDIHFHLTPEDLVKMTDGAFHYSKKHKDKTFEIVLTKSRSVQEFNFDAF